jgi:hypothetical protein
MARDYQPAYYGSGIALSDPSDRGYDITPSNLIPLDQAALKFLFVGTGGNLVVKFTASGDEVTYSNIEGGSWLPIRPLYIMETSTASGIVGHE